MVGRVRMGHRGSVDVAANEASLWPQRQHDGTQRIHEAGGAADAARVGATAKGVEVGGNTKERTWTEDGMEGARQGAEGESSKEGADLLWGRQGNQVSPGVNEEVLLSSGLCLCASGTRGCVFA